MKNKILYSIILLTTIIVISNINIFKNDFIFLDDYKIILNNPEIKDLRLEKIINFFMPSKAIMKNCYFYYNPLRVLTVAIDYKLYGENPWGYHLTCLLFHILASIAAFFFTLQLSKKLYVAFWTALFFSLHPVHVEPVVWINIRHYSMAAFFIFFSLFFYAKRTKLKAAYFVSVFFYICAFLSHPSAVALFLLFILYDVHFDSEWKMNWRQTVKQYAPYIIAGLVAYQIDQYYGYAGGVYGFTNDSWKVALIKTVTRFTAPFVMLVLPFDLYYNGYNFQFLKAPFLIEYLKICLLFLSIILLLAIKFYNKQDRIKSFGIFWIFICLAPSLPMSIFERYLHIPSFGFCLLLASYLEEIRNKNAFAYAIAKKIVSLFLCIAIASVYFAITIRKNTFWRSSETFSKFLLKSSAPAVFPK